MSSQSEPRHPRGIRARAVVLTGMTVFAFSMPASGPAGAAGRGYDTFRGSCEFPATVRFDPPLTGSTQQVHATAHGRGTCTGTWVTASGRRRTLDGAPVVYHAEADGRQSCSGSEGTSGPGYLRWGRRKISFTFFEMRVGVYTPIRLEGKRGGVFEGRADPNEEQDPVELLEKCASSGLDEALVVIRGSTAPRISG